MFGEFPVTLIVRELERDNLLPGILFRSSRRQCDEDVTRLAKNKRCWVSEEDQESIRKEIEEVITKYSLQRDIIYENLHYESLIKTASGAHHAGQLLMWRLLLEELMCRGRLRLLVATGTVAAGVDFPARSCVVTAHSKRGSDGFRVLAPSEFQQMSGRAGRRGKDAIGICVIAPSPYSDARVIHDVARRPPEPLKSAYFAAPSTVLNLLRYRNVDDLKYTVEKSFAAFLDRQRADKIRQEAQQLEESAGEKEERDAKKQLKRARRKVREAEVMEARQLTFLSRSLEGLEALGHVEDGALTEKGFWSANLCTSLVLEIAEAIEEGLLDDLGLVQLAGVVGSIAGDPHRNYFRLQRSPIPDSYLAKMAEIVERVEAVYERPGTNEVRAMSDAAVTVAAWMDSESWSEFSAYLRLAGVAEGDVARLISQTADHLNQISRLMKTHEVLAVTADEARFRLLRPPFSEHVAITDGKVEQ